MNSLFAHQAHEYSGDTHETISTIEALTAERDALRQQLAQAKALLNRFAEACDDGDVELKADTDSLFVRAAGDSARFVWINTQSRDLCVGDLRRCAEYLNGQKNG